jgi:hypothetical protein
MMGCRYATERDFILSLHAIKTAGSSTGERKEIYLPGNREEMICSPDFWGLLFKTLLFIISLIVIFGC